MRELADLKFCAIVPVYRHESTTRKVAESLSALGLAVILVDDGNSSEGHAILEQVAREVPDTILVTHAKNGGKGKAVISGLKVAFEKGYTHALQVDADGQHDMASIPFFLKAAKKHPNDLVAGMPQYDSSVPKAREQGRKITNFWVAIETLSKDIPDSMCGFRIYPVASTWPVAQKLRSFRMGFDIEILVRLSWAGMKMRFYPVKVIYPEGGVSNFRVFHDNVAISFTHTRLCLGMMLRLPVILARRLRKKK
jgi:glycosyltransferase involved in cell wall biosynthesis